MTKMASQKTKRVSKRLRLPDVLRGLAIVFMILIHVMNLYGNAAAMSGWPYTLLDFLAGPPTGPIFMFTMGFFFMLKKPRFVPALRRGLTLILLGYGLNILKGFVPVFFAREILRWDPAFFPKLYSAYYLIFEVEILIFAGLAYIAMAALSRLSDKPIFYAGVALGIALVSPWLWGIGETVPVVKHLVLPLWGADPDLAVFPFFPWAVYPILGMATALAYKRDPHPRRLWILSSSVGVALLVLGGGLLLLDFDRFFNDYGQQGWGATLAFSGFIFLWGMAMKGLDSVYPERLKVGLLPYLSRNITTIYVFQWLIIGWMFYMTPFHSLSLGWVLVCSIIVAGLSCGLTEVYNRLRKASA